MADVDNAPLNSTYQMKLFDWYPISVLFDRHIRWAEEFIIHSPISHDARDLFCGSKDCLEICPLDLKLDRQMKFELRDGVRSSGDQCYQQLYTIPYEGDGELWHLFPSHLIGMRRPVGEVQRNELIIAFNFVDPADADRAYRRTLASVQQYIEEQRSCIDEYQDIVRSAIWRRIVAQQTSPGLQYLPLSTSSLGIG